MAGTRAAQDDSLIPTHDEKDGEYDDYDYSEKDDDHDYFDYYDYCEMDDDYHAVNGDQKELARVTHSNQDYEMRTIKGGKNEKVGARLAGFSHQADLHKTEIESRTLGWSCISMCV